MVRKLVNYQLLYYYGLNIRIANIDGSGVLGLGGIENPSIALFDDTKVVYSTQDIGDYLGDIYIMNSDGSDKKKLARNGDNPRFSNDGTKIVFPGQYQTNKKDFITN